jgi:hypothetical protein
MITVQLSLVWGVMRDSFEEYDYVDFEFHKESDGTFTVDSINDWLNIHVQPECNYAELYIEVPLFDVKQLVGTFKTLKLKSGKTKWIVSD